MPVHYNYAPSETCAIIPAPHVNIQKQHLKRGDGKNIGTTFSITLTGTMITDRGSPIAFTALPGSTFGGPYDAFWTGSTASDSSPNEPTSESIDAKDRLRALLRKQEALRALFQKDGMTLEFATPGGDNPIQCNPRVLSIDFPEGTWYDQMPYTIVLEADTLRGEGMANARNDDSDVELAEVLGIKDVYVSAATEDWSIDTNDQPESVGIPFTYQITHSMTATGKRHYVDGSTGAVVREAWENAKAYVESFMGLDKYPYSDGPGSITTFASGVRDIPNYYVGYNHATSENLDKQGGGYAVTETWLLASGNALEEFSISFDGGVDTALESIGVNGTITGLETSSSQEVGQNSTPNKYTNAKAKYDTLYDNASINSAFYQRAVTAATEFGITTTLVNQAPASLGISKDEIGGTIGYTLSFDNRAPNCITGTDSESIQIQDTLPGDVFASIPVLGRATGPVLQYINTQTEYRRSLSIELVMTSGWQFCTPNSYLDAMLNKPSLTTPQNTELADIIEGVSPANDVNIKRYFVNPSPTESWNPKEGRYTFNIEWTYELTQ